MWHVSVANPVVSGARPYLEEMAYLALKGVGDSALGEWTDGGQTVFHLRRRLSNDEAEQVGPVWDIRQIDHQLIMRAKIIAKVTGLPVEMMVH